MLAPIRNLLLIILFVFLAAFSWFNFNFLYSQTATQFLDQPKTAQIQEAEYGGQTYLFPLSPDKERPKTVSENLPPRTGASNAVITSSTILVIPSLGVKTPIVFEPTTTESRIYSALEKGAVHYAKTPKPGQLGTSIILGHSSVYPWYKGNYGYIFSKLANLKSGDIISIQNNNQFLNYRVSGSIIFSPVNPDDYQLREFESSAGSSIVLMTCWPTGTNAKRVAVKADLI